MTIVKTYHEKRNEIEESRVSSLLSMKPNGTLHHGILTHQNNRISTQTLANVLQLVGSNIVSGSDQNLTVLIQKLAQLLVVCDLLVGLGWFHRH